MPAQPEASELLMTIDRETFDSFLLTLDETSDRKISSSCVVYERGKCSQKKQMIFLCSACDSATADQGRLIEQLTQKGFKRIPSTLISYDSLISELQRADGRTVRIEHHNSKIILKNMH